MEFFRDEMIVKRIPKAVRERTRENMNDYNMGLYDAFDDAVRECANKRSTELRNAWYHSDYRAFIPSANKPEFLDFKAYPLKYKKEA